MSYHNVNAEDFAQVVSFCNDVKNYVDNLEREGRSAELAYDNHEVNQGIGNRLSQSSKRRFTNWVHALDKVGNVYTLLEWLNLKTKSTAEMFSFEEQTLPISQRLVKNTGRTGRVAAAQVEPRQVIQVHMMDKVLAKDVLNSKHC